MTLEGFWLDRASDALGHELNWLQVIEAAREHGVLALLYRNLQRFSSRVPERVLGQIRQEVLATSGRNLFLAHELLRIIRLLESADIAVIPLKGPALASLVYGDISLRSYGDLDLLIRPADVKRARHVLTEAGYQAEFEESSLETRFTYAAEQVLRLIRPGFHNVVIEMHWQIDPRNLNLAMLNTLHLWERRISQRFCGSAVSSLSHEDLLLYLCIHGAKHCWDKLEWIASVSELLRAVPISWERVQSSARTIGGERALHLGLALAYDLAGPERATDLPARELHPTSRALARQVWHMMVASDREHTRGALYRYSFYLRVRDRLPDRGRVLLFSTIHLLRPRLLRRKERTMRLNQILNDARRLAANKDDLSSMQTVQSIEVRGIRNRVHLASIRAADAFLTKIGRRVFVSHAIWLFGKVFGQAGRARVFISPGIILNVPLSDQYWMGAALARQYEPEIVAFLANLSERDTLFIDCGANIGWWSLMAEKRFGWKCVAVEAAPDIVRRLEENRASSNASFEIVDRAIWDREGERLQFLTGADIHAGGHLRDVGGFLRRRAPQIEEVTTTTIDALTERWLESHAAARIIVKIDVEGAEEQALAGARRTIERGALIIYEDHGSDENCEPTRAVLKSGMLTFAIIGGLLRPITDIRDARRLKTNTRIGYNFAALLPTSPCMPDIEALLKKSANRPKTVAAEGVPSPSGAPV